MSTAALSAEPSLSQRLGLILGGLRERLAVRAAKDRALAVIVLILWNRLSRTLSRLTAIAARHQAGTLRAPPKIAHRRVSAPPPPRDPLPRQSGWLVRRVPDCAVYGEYLNLLLAEPEMAAMIQAAPQLRRLLRPLWRMLRTDKVPPALRQTPAAPAGPRRRTPGPRPTRPRAPSDPRPAARAESAASLKRRLFNRA